MQDAHVTSQFHLTEGMSRTGCYELNSERDLDLRALLVDLQDASAEYIGEGEISVKPVRLAMSRGDLVLDWWFDWFRDRTKDLKCWAGQVTTEKLINDLQSYLPINESSETILHTPRMMKTKFGIDPRSAWSSLDVGYSPNEHNQDAATFPAVELLGAIGLQGFRPYVKKRSDVQFHLWPTPLGTVPARRAAIDPWDILEARSFRFQIAKRGQSYKYFSFAAPVERSHDKL